MVKECWSSAKKTSPSCLQNTGANCWYGIKTNCMHKPGLQNTGASCQLEWRQIACRNLENRAQEQVANTGQRRIACTENRTQEQVANAERTQIARMNPENRAQEQVANTARRRLTKERPSVLENQALGRREIGYQMATKFDVLSGTYLYHQPCEIWNVECQHGCGYPHLSSSTRSTWKKFCMDGLLSSCSCNFNKDVMVKLDMKQLPVFMRLSIHYPNFHEECTTFNNILSMAATKVCN